MSERDPLTGRWTRAGTTPAQEAPVSITEDSTTTTGPATTADPDPAPGEDRDGRVDPPPAAFDADGFLVFDGVQYVPRADLVAAEELLEDQADGDGLDHDGVGALVSYRIYDRFTSTTLAGLGVVVRAAGEDNASVRVAPLSPSALEVDAAALTPATVDELAAR